MSLITRKYIWFTYPIGFNKYHKKILKTWKKSHLTRSLQEHLHGGVAKGDEFQTALIDKRYEMIIKQGTHPKLSYYLNYLEQNIVTKILSRTILKIFLPLLRLPKGDERRYFFVTKLDKK